MPANVHVTRARISRNAPGGGVLPLLDSVPAGGETIATGAASETGDLVAQEGEVWVVSVQGGPVVIAFGLDPEAGVTPGWRLKDGEVRDFAVTDAGETYAVKDA